MTEQKKQDPHPSLIVLVLLFVSMGAMVVALWLHVVIRLVEWAWSLAG